VGQHQVDNDFDDDFVEDLQFVVGSKLLENLHFLIVSMAFCYVWKIPVVGFWIFFQVPFRRVQEVRDSF
jgi:hypothetical protein